VAVDAETGKTRWTWSDPDVHPRPETLASDGKRAYLQVGEAVVCLDLATGKPKWTTGKTGAPPRKKLSFGTDVLVVAEGVVLCALGDKLTAIDAETGKVRWERPAGGGFHAPPDVFVIDGLVWTGDHPRDSVAPPPVTDFNQAVDLETGQVRRENQIMVDLQSSGHHHRCYREKATVRYIITGKRGVEMMDLAGERHSRNNWVRGTCQYGILPANGLLYAPPNSCGCYMESLLHGFYALAAKEPAVADTSRRVPDGERLEKGPAFGQVENPESEIENDSWPTYRHDPLRSGVAGTDLPAELNQVWQADLGGRPTQPVIAEGMAVVAARDTHRVVALDSETGERRWSYTAGGRIDSPPTLFQGRVLFGSADGRVTCLRLSDGELLWRFMAAPADLRTVAMDQVESLWPVHGSVLVLPGGGAGGKAIAYCAAGRSTWLDGGIHLYGLDPARGRVLHRTQLATEHPAFREGKDEAKDAHETRIAQNTTDYKTFLQSDRSDSFSMAGGAISDVLVSNGTDVFLHHVRFGPDLTRREAMGRHLFSTSSLLDGAENHRSHWVLGTGDFSRIPVAYSWIVNRPNRWSPGIAVPTGIAMVFTDRAVWGVQRKGDANGRYHLFRGSNEPFSPDTKPLPDFRERPKGKKGEIRSYDWQQDLPVRTRAMLKAGKRLVLGVWPVEIPDGDPHAAYEGRLGGSLWLVSDKDGTKVGEVPLPHPVVWDGLAAAHGRLYVATTSGQVLCFGAK
jgi:outer membrane protein assembly factor BamB